MNYFDDQLYYFDDQKNILTKILEKYLKRF